MNMTQGNQMKHAARLLFLIFFTVLFSGCQKYPYQPSEIEALKNQKAVVRLTFQTPKGRQCAFYFPPQNAPQSMPDPLVIVYPGIGGRALDWFPFAENAPGGNAGFLILDYPGRGFNEGLMRPRDLPQTSEGALEALATQFHFDKQALQHNICQCGHSFGCGAALQYAQEAPVRKIVLLAPFTTLHKAMFRQVGPLAWLNPDTLDNQKMIRALLSRTDPPEITIIHGAEDETIPVEMGRALGLIDEDHIHYHEIPDATHMSIIEKNRDIAYKALFKSAP